MESYGVWSCTNRKPTHDFRIPLDTKFFSICHRLAVVSLPCYDLSVRPPVSLWGMGYREHRGKKLDNWILTPYSYAASIHTIALSWPLERNAHLLPTDRETDRRTNTILVAIIAKGVAPTKHSPVRHIILTTTLGLHNYSISSSITDKKLLNNMT